MQGKGQVSTRRGPLSTMKVLLEHWQSRVNAKSILCYTHLQGAVEGQKTASNWIPMWGFPKILGTFLGVSIIRTIVYLGLYWGPPILGTTMCLLNVTDIRKMQFL